MQNKTRQIIGTAAVSGIFLAGGVTGAQAAEDIEDTTGVATETVITDATAAQDPLGDEEEEEDPYPVEDEDEDDDEDDKKDKKDRAKDKR
jgi:hypothetical protein